MKDDAFLIEQARQGDQGAFVCLVTRYQKFVYNLALGQTGHHHDAEEITQITFCKVWQGLPSFQGRSAFSTWLYRLTINASLDFLRKQQTHQTDLSLDDPDLPPVPDRAPTPEAVFAARERRNALQQAMTQLSEPFREILLLREAEGLSYQEIAQRLHIEVGTVRSRLARARLALREILLKNGNFETESPSKKQKGRQGKGGGTP